MQGHIKVKLHSVPEYDIDRPTVKNCVHCMGHEDFATLYSSTYGPYAHP